MFLRCKLRGGLDAARERHAAPTGRRPNHRPVPRLKIAPAGGWRHAGETRAAAEADSQRLAGELAVVTTERDRAQAPRRRPRRDAARGGRPCGAGRAGGGAGPVGGRAGHPAGRGRAGAPGTGRDPGGPGGRATEERLHREQRRAQDALAAAARAEADRDAVRDQLAAARQDRDTAHAAGQDAETARRSAEDRAASADRRPRSRPPGRRPPTPPTPKPSAAPRPPKTDGWSPSKNSGRAGEPAVPRGASRANDGQGSRGGGEPGCRPPSPVRPDGSRQHPTGTLLRRHRSAPQLWL